MPADLGEGGSGLTDVEAAGRLAGDDVACLVDPAAERLRVARADGRSSSTAAHAAGGLFVTFADPVSLAILEAPGRYGADIVTAEGQQLGIPLSFGGPYLGLMAARMDAVRQLPGRLVGATRDAEGRRGYVLTLQAREQHIRREKAASNICTNQALCALAATAYLAAVGPEGLHEVAERSAAQARHLVATLEAAGIAERRFTAPYLNEVALRVPGAARRHAALVEQGIVAGLVLEAEYPELPDALLLAATELTTDDDISRLATALGASG